MILQKKTVRISVKNFWDLRKKKIHLFQLKEQISKDKNPSDITKDVTEQKSEFQEGQKIRLKGEGKQDNYGRKGDLYPDAVIINVTMRAIDYQGIENALCGSDEFDMKRFIVFLKIFTLFFEIFRPV